VRVGVHAPGKYCDRYARVLAGDVDSVVKGMGWYFKIAVCEVENTGLVFWRMVNELQANS